MLPDSDPIYSLISKKLTGDISPGEAAALDQWLGDSPENRAEFNDLAALWQQSQQLRFPGKIDRPAALEKVRRHAGLRKASKFRLNLFYQVAAILLLSVLFSGLYNYFISGTRPSGEYFEEVLAAYGTRSQVGLPDGSTVYLNSGSSLKFSSRFADRKQRLISLKGEAYFDVAKDPKRPFIVKAGAIEVEALGTEFNVDAYEPDEAIDVVLVEGKVAVNVLKPGAGKDQMVLDPHELARFDAKENKLIRGKTGEMEKHVGWIDGKIVFMDDPIRDVIRELEHWYHVQIELTDPRLVNYRFTGTFIDEPVEEILNVFSMTSPLSYEITPAEKDGQNRFSKRIIKLKIE
ncbi:FecR domain-containing protein [Gaoshiqia sp. Z1-71]|uniref:FecR domain-containing protein n=1 Tax=Gaoshiqia hydrogeniformans TaxID=3290090 RepID=UPI003BF81547